jgi:hypothetical protein
MKKGQKTWDSNYPKMGIAISTYAPSMKFDNRLTNCMRSLRESGFPGYVVIVDDGSPIDRKFPSEESRGRKVYWETGLSKTKPTIIQLPERRGIAYCKNMCMWSLRTYHGIAGGRLTSSIGFLADDDILFQEGWWEPYVKAIRQTKKPHFCWTKPSIPHTEGKINELLVRRTDGANGCLMTYNKKVLDKVGGMAVHPQSLWGWDHNPWTDRINRVFGGAGKGQALDVMNSDNLISLQDVPSPVSEEERNENKNFKFGTEHTYLDLWELVDDWEKETLKTERR